jgi:hypothetical protein
VGSATVVAVAVWSTSRMAMLLLLLLPAGLVLTLGLVGYGFGSLAGECVPGADRQRGLRSLAALTGAVSAAVYTWGLLIVAGTVLEAEDGGTSSSPLLPCREPVRWERALEVVDYTVDYVPLRFVCVMQDGGEYAAESVPGYVNPVVAAFALASAASASAAAFEGERRAREAR